jgi:1-acyl-sn-glycerol-3-phosphate acyltransferase
MTEPRESLPGLLPGPPERNRSAGEAVRAVAFIAIMYALLLGMGLVSLPSSAVSRRSAINWAKRYARSVRWLLRAICRIGWEIRGPAPSGPYIVASKHQSFLDVLMLIDALPSPRFVMKRSLLWVPVIGFFGRRLGCVAIDRNARGEAVRAMLAGFAAQADDPGQIVIFPQGTRVAPGSRAPFRAGVLRLYESFDLPVVLAAANTGWFWPRTGIRRTPGTAVVEFVETIPPGTSPATLLARVEAAIESGSERLAAEAAAEITRKGDLG